MIRSLLSLGWILSTLFIVGVVLLGTGLPGYNPTIDAIEEISSFGFKYYFSFKLLLISVFSMLVIFSMALVKYARKRQLSIWPPVLLMTYAFSHLIMASQNDLFLLTENSMLLDAFAYMTPLLFLYHWGDKLGPFFSKMTIRFILLFIAVFSIKLIATISPLPCFADCSGLVQRMLVFALFLYFPFLGLYLREQYEYRIGI